MEMKARLADLSSRVRKLLADMKGLQSRADKMLKFTSNWRSVMDSPYFGRSIPEQAMRDAAEIGQIKPMFKSDLFETAVDAATLKNEAEKISKGLEKLIKDARPDTELNCIASAMDEVALRLYGDRHILEYSARKLNLTVQSVDSLILSRDDKEIAMSNAVAVSLLSSRIADLKSAAWAVKFGTTPL